MKHQVNNFKLLASFWCLLPGFSAEIEKNNKIMCDERLCRNLCVNQQRTLTETIKTIKCKHKQVDIFLPQRLL